MSLPSPLPFVAKAPVVPVVVIERLEDAVPLARALVEGGLPLIEVTLRTPVAMEALRLIAAEVEGAIAGAGTVTNRAQIEATIEAGATFLVSPGTTPELAAAFTETPIPVMAGCATASEAMRLAELGFEVLKFFPAEASGGAAFLKSIAGPLPHLRFCPTGGIGPANAGDYLALPNVVAVGGSWVVPTDAIRAGNFAKVRELATAASQLKRAAKFG
ncbi:MULTISPECIES: bifunctional 4-hydroxy-2-oxoglutarate aldolase/2-dehydro-3-deoxy-phosphogluconate aldolase [Xanthobacter]|uniref:bifunctional 4-hydroxy-2-oxoglutarate aldolase/2-dehydro-3-deoxy-phosphogluconate aldolase n=1 Tax=Xanthobacter TaxID=279 RepID=UPI001ACB804A|nr:MULTISPECIES: bifunctional 4-hydroxy-2-oxoglutarate aldolase/2-dehydro-3-deoxy-phosphogluconate aldolase [Xanthobacter]MBN8915536.1 bifunctional 4-hydroxy-2-oxoglutarate aldolase/2-dehydro-3-deoxy-phosphogluconate aldolase [Hyphomicrobiales bacterium]UDQ88064.1 bifunctional 4-hydroxy-2-oxoglutarate aldolase/2-dehydro-3-deoxy-phosphogluconate aldolase [Xanthobacter autotrophicus]UJX44892.1 bifunctional 4-hydroxy-2-oxoglutarate aldolase/2-dehydro-3-deoxy-phosphogluconate aldolase [Xanthobacter 